MNKHSLRFFRFACLLIVLAFAAPVSVAQQLSPATPPAMQIQPPRRGTELVALARAQGTVKLIVDLNISFTPEGSLINPAIENVATSARVLAQRSSIAAAKATLFQGFLGANFTVTAALDGLPGMAVTTDAAGVQRLLTSRLVKDVYEDIMLPPTMGYTLPLIHASSVGGAWDQGVDGSNFSVVILDTGALSTHEFISGKVVAEACFSTNSGTSIFSLCPGGVTSSTSSGAANPFARCVSLTGNPEECTHGTHVAGTVAGNYSFYNAASLVQPINMGGVARGATLIPIQVFSYIADCGAGVSCVRSFTSNLLSATNYIYNTLASVGPGAGSYNIASINMSLGGGQYFGSNCDSSDPVMQASLANLRAVGIAPAIASGNEGFVDSMGSPGCLSAAVAVGATEVNYLSGPDSLLLTPNWPDNAWCQANVATTCYGSGGERIASFSNGSAALELLAPGFFVESSVLGATSGVTNTYAQFEGTSMATPHVAGAWAVLKQQSPIASVNRLLATLQNTGVAFTDSAYTGNSSAFPPSLATYRSDASGSTFNRIDVGAAVLQLGRDFGDAPNTYSTLNASSGARHIRVPEYYLGASADSEADGTPGSDDGDDGVTFPTMNIGTSVNVNVTASVVQAAGTAPNNTYLGRLYGWIDFNRDGDFADAGEQIANGTIMTGPYPQAISVSIPAGASGGSTWARFRYSTQTGLSYTGQAYNGEVEDYNINLVSPAPEIVVEAPGSVNIADGSTYNLGTTLTGTPINRTITVRNTGAGSLTISTNPPTTTGDFTAGNFGSTTIASNGSTTFTLTCDATSAGAPSSGTISFANNDTDENPFNFTVQCTVTDPAPEISVEAPGPTQLGLGATYDMGSTTLGTPIDRTITVYNTGTGNLTISTNPPTTTGDFTAGNFGSTTIAPNSTTTFTLTCDATNAGAPISGTVSFANDDSDETLFLFNVECTVSLPAPEIVVEAPGSVNIPDGGSYEMGLTDFGLPINQTITVRNTGTDHLTISTNPPTTTDDFTAGNFGSTTIAPNGSTTFTLTCNATNTGSPVSGTVMFDNNDGDEGEFDFIVNCAVNESALGVAPQRTYFNTHTPTLTWNPLTSVTIYDVQIANNSAFTGAITYLAINGTTFTTPTISNGVYYWRVRPFGTNSWSTGERFVIAAVP